MPIWRQALLISKRGMFLNNFKLVISQRYFFLLSLLKRIDELETTLSQKLETIDVRLNGVESTLNTIATNTR